MSPEKKERETIRARESLKKEATPEKASFEIPPPPIPAKDIKEAITADVVVVGAGVSGLTAALSAAEAGAKVILLEKTATFNQRGLHNAALHSRLQRKLGIKVDKDQVIYTIMEYAGYRNDQRLVKLWADNCGRVMDWLLDMAEAANIEVILDSTTKDWYFPNYPTMHIFMPKWQETLCGMLQKNAEKRGVNIHFETPAVRLLRKRRGRVTGVIAKNKQGDYIQFNARKAVILCTGDYGANPEMIKKYLDAEWLSGLRCVYEPAINTGDGLKMALWIGADVDHPPHLSMNWDFADFCGVWLFNLGRQPWLYVNVNSERFMNEDLPYHYECNQLLQQPGGVAWSIWDAKWDQEWPKMKSQCCKNMGPPTYLWDPRQLDDEVAKGHVRTAQTIEELAKKIDVPVETFKATVERYNQLARNGKDEDFGKHPDRLTTLEKPPFYACKFEVRRMVILSGLKINSRLQVLDTERKAIPGLYAAGNVSGSFFGNSYPTTVPGLTHSRAWTFGRLAGLNAAAEKV